MRILLMLIMLLATPALARDPSQWSHDPTTQQWFQGLMQPDNPHQSCCGESDTFEADNYDTEGDHYVAIITDGYGVWPTGTRISVPNYKVNLYNSNPTGHGYLFLKPGTKEVFCYAPPSSG